MVSIMCPADAELIRFEKRTLLSHPGGLYLKIPAYADLPILDIISKRNKWVYLPHCLQTFHMEIVGLRRLRFSFNLDKEQQRMINTWNGSQSSDLNSSLPVFPPVKSFSVVFTAVTSDPIRHRSKTNCSLCWHGLALKHPRFGPWKM